jgi:DNA replication protein
MIQFMLEKTKQATIQSNKEDEINLYTIFEQEFGRPLSPFECETLGMWMDQDHHDPTIIKAALREAVISGKLNFRYIDRILFEWKKNGIKTLNQANEYGKKFRKSNLPSKQQNQVPINKPNKNTVPFYNWLD